MEVSPNVQPSVRMDVKWFCKILMRKNSNNVTLTRVFFQDIIKLSKTFQTEGFFLMWFYRPYLLLYNEESVKAFSNEVREKSSIYDSLKDVLGNGLLGSTEETWKIHRKLLNPAFTSGALKDKMKIFNENAIDLVQNLQNVVDKPTENLLDILKLCIFNIMSESVLGLKMNDEKFVSKVAKYMKVVDEGSAAFVDKIARPWAYWKILLPFSESGRRLVKLLSLSNEFINEVVQEVKKSAVRSENVIEHSDYETVTRKSVTEILIDHHLEDSSFTMADVSDHVQNFILAGHDTAARTLLWCLYLLGQHPEVQQNVYDEIESAVRGDEVNLDELHQLKYSECVIKETLRLYPVVPLYGRKSKKEIQCGKYTIPKGTEIIFFPFMLHRNPDVYPNPEKFDPDRFFRTSLIRPSMYIPFADGTRNCIGNKFAMMEMKTILALVVRRFKIASLDKIEDSDLDWTIVLNSAKPVRMLFSLRES